MSSHKSNHGTGNGSGHRSNRERDRPNASRTAAASAASAASTAKTTPTDNDQQQQQEEVAEEESPIVPEVDNATHIVVEHHRTGTVRTHVFSSKDGKPSLMGHEIPDTTVTVAKNR